MKQYSQPNILVPLRFSDKIHRHFGIVAHLVEQFYLRRTKTDKTDKKLQSFVCHILLTSSHVSKRLMSHEMRNRPFCKKMCILPLNNVFLKMSINSRNQLNFFLTVKIWKTFKRKILSVGAKI